MKKVITFLTMVLIMTVLKLSSQTLINTKWVVTDPTQEITYYYHFTTDTIFVSEDNVTFTPQSKFTSDKSTITMHDVTGVMCATNITGYYSYYLGTNNVTFALTSDNCINRVFIMTTYNWSKMPAGIQTVEPVSFSVSPNPSTGIFTVKLNSGRPAKILVYNLTGETVFSTKIKSLETNIDLSSLPKGIYFLRINSEGTTAVEKIALR
jgi:hypothetical protein